MVLHKSLTQILSLEMNWGEMNKFRLLRLSSWFRSAYLVDFIFRFFFLVFSHFQVSCLPPLSKIQGRVRSTLSHQLTLWKLEARLNRISILFTVYLELRSEQSSVVYIVVHMIHLKRYEVLCLWIPHSRR